MPKFDVVYVPILDLLLDEKEQVMVYMDRQCVNGELLCKIYPNPSLFVVSSPMATCNDVVLSKNLQSREYTRCGKLHTSPIPPPSAKSLGPLWSLVRTHDRKSIGGRCGRRRRQ